MTEDIQELGSFKHHSDHLVEWIPATDAEVDSTTQLVFNHWLQLNTTKPFALLFEWRDDNYFDFDGIRNFGNQHRLKAIAMIATSRFARLSAESFVEINTIAFPSRPMRIFNSRDSALTWLNTL
ncbi:hypothetical protein [Echinimonas agarilytica]|uniref:DUF7793 domain-containing protein n=1 Tax=Echinimonas agarilytica TaxID=1215918 RepID=A0AA42B701_9GAMM|nr:hypothetical protein [Echinimonas agarilytica]MCM2679300.1 hypothetical protein [Echinimonas agarilytica]